MSSLCAGSRRISEDARVDVVAANGRSEEVRTVRVSAATDRAFLYLGAYTADAILDPIWRHFHGRSRKPGATYLDAADVLRELGLKPTIEVVEVPVRGRFTSVADAAKDYRDQLCLPDTAEVRKELRGILADWLVPRGDALGAPLKTVPAAIISWPTRGPGGSPPGN